MESNDMSNQAYSHVVPDSDLLTPTALQWVLEEAGFTLEDLT